MTTSFQYEDAYEELKQMRKNVIKQHGEALQSNNDRARKACDWGITRLERGMREILRHADAIDDAESQGNRVRAQVHTNLLNESKEVVITEVKHELRTYAINVTEQKEEKPKGKKLCGSCKGKDKTGHSTASSHGHDSVKAGHTHGHNQSQQPQPQYHQQQQQQPYHHGHPSPVSPPPYQAVAPPQPGYGGPYQSLPYTQQQIVPQGYVVQEPNQYVHPQTPTPLPQGQPQPQQQYLPPSSTQPAPPQL